MSECDRTGFILSLHGHDNHRQRVSDGREQGYGTVKISMRLLPETPIQHWADEILGVADAEGVRTDHPRSRSGPPTTRKHL